MEYLKEVWNIFFAILAIIILTSAIVYPFCIGLKEFPNWIVLLIYPLAILIMAYINYQIKKR